MILANKIKNISYDTNNFESKKAQEIWDAFDKKDDNEKYFDCIKTVNNGIERDVSANAEPYKCIQEILKQNNTNLSFYDEDINYKALMFNICDEAQRLYDMATNIYYEKDAEDLIELHKSLISEAVINDIDAISEKERFDDMMYQIDALEQEASLKKEDNEIDDCSL